MTAAQTNGHSGPAGPVDPVTRQLIRGSLRAARLECELIIERTAMSAFIREKKDYIVSFLDGKGQEIYGETMGSDILGCVWACYPRRIHASWRPLLVQRPLHIPGKHHTYPGHGFHRPGVLRGECVGVLPFLRPFLGPGRFTPRQHRPGQHRDFPRRHTGPSDQDRQPG